MKSIYRKRVGKNLSVIDYRDFRKLPKDDFILYYPSNYTEGGGLSGHYVAVINRPDTIYYYDSYGIKPNYVKHLKSTDKNLYQEMKSTFIQELLKSGKSIDYNNYRHQKGGNNISTCGRHSLMRILKNDLNVENYDKFINSHGIEPDNLVSLMFN